MITKIIKEGKSFLAILTVFVLTLSTSSQMLNNEFKLKSLDDNGLNLSSSHSKPLLQKPSKKIYFVPGGKIGMFFLQGDFSDHQLIAVEAFGKYVGENFFAEISVPFRFKTSPAFTDIGIDLNVMYPFLGSANKSEVDPFIGGGLGLHFIGRDKGEQGQTTVAARGGLGLNLIVGTVFFKNYDFNVILELKYFNYLREFDESRYHGIGINVGATFPR